MDSLQLADAASSIWFLGRRSVSGLILQCVVFPDFPPEQSAAGECGTSAATQKAIRIKTIISISTSCNPVMKREPSAHQNSCLLLLSHVASWGSAVRNLLNDLVFLQHLQHFKYEPCGNGGERYAIKRHEECLQTVAQCYYSR